MTDHEFDDQIRSALLDATMERWAPVLDGTEELVWSPKHQHVMDQLCRDPFGAAKRRVRPRWRKTLSAAACVLLACSVAFGGLMNFSPSARAWVQRVWEEWTAQYTAFHFQGTGSVEVENWKLNDLPEGYTQVSMQEAAGFFSFTYENGDGERLYFDYMPVVDGGSFDIDNEHSIYREITLNGQTAHLFVSNQELWPSCLIWFDERGDMGFQLIGYVSSEQLLQMAESVSPIK